MPASALKPDVEARAAGMAAGTLAAAHVSMRFGGLTALDDVSITIAPGTITGIVGPNGAGKSTLFNLLAGTERPTTGSVMLNGADITGRPMHQRAHDGIVRTFQLARELDSLTVLENLLLATPRHPGEQLWRLFLTPGAIRHAEDAAHDRAHSLLKRVRLSHLADHPAGVLSGGQKKLLELTRSLMLKPRIVLLDEPAAGVNPALIDELSDFILSLRNEGLTFAIVEHNMDMVAALCDPVYVLAGGSLLAQGDFATVTGDPRVIQAYLGDSP